MRQAHDKVTIQKSVTILTRYLTDIRDRIINSAHHMPTPLRAVFKMLRQRNAERWPGEDHVVRHFEDRENIVVREVSGVKLFFMLSNEVGFT